MKSIGELVKGARGALEIPKFAKQLEVSKTLISQLEHNRPVVITDENLEKLAKGGIQIPAQQLDTHNYVARECDKAKRYDVEFRKKLILGYAPASTPIPMDPKLVAAVEAVEKELADHGTVGGEPVDTSKMVQGPAVPAAAPKAHLAPVQKSRTKKAAAPKTAAKPAQPATRQGFLPGFLDQMSNVKINEMITQLLYQRLQERIDQRLDEIFGTQKEG
jgi:transcriptional regulator with XRE-family HTH domain